MSKGSFQVVKYKDGKSSFELMTKPGTALKWREGKMVNLSDVLFSEEIYSDQSKGDRANEADLERAFKTSNVSDIAKVILEKGDLQLSTAERKEKVEQRRKEIVNYIHKYYIDPRTKTPHPITRIDSALTQMKVNIDPFVPVEKQFHEKIEKKLPEIIAIKKCEMAGTLKIPHAVIGSAQGIVKKWCTVGKEEWGGDGVVMEVSIVPGDYDTFCNEMNEATKGNYTMDVAGQSVTAVEATGRGKHGKGKAARGGKGKGQ